MSIFICCIISFLLLFNCTVACCEEIIFTGFPRVKNTASEENTKNEQVSDKDSYKVVITKETGNYYWFSRERKLLIYNKYIGPLGNVNHYFVAPDGSGYVFITQDSSGSIAYMENIRGLLFVITYWGSGEKPKL